MLAVGRGPPNKNKASVPQSVKPGVFELKPRDLHLESQISQKIPTVQNRKINQAPLSPEPSWTLYWVKGLGRQQSETLNPIM